MNLQRVALPCFLIILVFFGLFNGTSSNISQIFETNQKEDFSDTQEVKTATASGTHPPINVSVYSHSINKSQHLELVGDSQDPNTKGTIAMKLPSPPSYDQWFGRETFVSVYNLFDNRTWGLGNENFASGIDDGNPIPNQSNAISDKHNDTFPNWNPDFYDISPGGGCENDLYAEYNETGQFANMTIFGNNHTDIYWFNGGDHVALNQTGIKIDRGDIRNAWIRFQYNPWRVIVYETPFVGFSIEINGEPVYERDNSQFTGPGLIDTGWVPMASWVNTSDVFTPPSPSGYEFNYSLKWKSLGSSVTTIPLETHEEIHFHGFSLAIEAATQPNASQVQLQVNGLPIEGTDFGSGEIDIHHLYPNFISENPFYLTFNSTTTAESIDVSFDVDITFHTMKFKGSTQTPQPADMGVAWAVRDANTIIYKFYVYVYWDLANFFNPFFNFSIPSDWSMMLARNPELTVVYNRSEGINWGLDGGSAPDGYFLVPSKNATGTSLAEIPGWWYFEANGPNYLSSLKTSRKEGSTWVDASIFNSLGYTAGDLLKVQVQVTNLTGVPPSVQYSTATLEIISPNGSVWGSWENTSIHPFTGDINFGPFELAGCNTTGGTFQVHIWWDYTFDYLSGYEKVVMNGSYYIGSGFVATDFLVVHDVEIAIINPIDAQTTLKASVNYFDIFSLKVFLNDTDTGVGVSQSVVMINWSSPIMLEEESSGLYSSIFIVEELGVSGLYFIEINASTFGYGNESIILELSVFAPSALKTISIESSVEFGHNLSFSILFYLPSDENYNYTGALINLSLAPTSGFLRESIDYSLRTLLNGAYAVNLTTGESYMINLIGQINLYIHASKQFVANSSLGIQFLVTNIATNISAEYNLFEIPRGESKNFSIVYQTIPGMIPVDSATVTLYGISSYSWGEPSPGLYEIQLLPGYGIKSYSISIVLQKQNYALATLDIVLLVKGIEEYVMTNESHISRLIQEGETATFSVSFFYDFTNQYLTTNEITVKYSWIYGSGDLVMVNNEFVLTIASQGVPAGDYTINVTAWDKNNNIFYSQEFSLTIQAVPLSPWVYVLSGGLLLLLILGIFFSYYVKVHRPRRIFKDQAIMAKYNKFLDAQNLQHLILIDKGSSITLASKNYGGGQLVDDMLVSGFIQAISAFGTELMGVDSAMENISYKGLRIMLVSGTYVNACLLLKGKETESIKIKAIAALGAFEQQFTKELKSFNGKVDVFEGKFDSFDHHLEVHLIQAFKVNRSLLNQVIKQLSTTQRQMLDYIVPKGTESFHLQDAVDKVVAHSEIKLLVPEIYNALFDLIQIGVLEGDASAKEKGGGGTTGVE